MSKIQISLLLLLFITVISKFAFPLPFLTWSFILLPTIAALIGWATNWVAIKMLFHPKKPIRILGVTFHGLFYKRQKELAASLGEIISSQLLSHDEIAEILLSESAINRMKGQIKEDTTNFLNKTLVTEFSTTKDKVSQAIQYGESNFKILTSNIPIIQEKILSYIANHVITNLPSIQKTIVGYAEKHLPTLISSSYPKLSGLASLLGGMNPIDPKKLSSKLDAFLSENLPSIVEKDFPALLEKISLFLQNELPLIIKNELPSLIENINMPSNLPEKLPLITDKLDTFLDNHLANLMESYLPRFLEGLNIEKHIKEKIEAFEISEMEKLFKDLLDKEFTLIEDVGAILGLCIGFLQLGIHNFL